MEVTVVVAQRTMRQYCIDLANTHEYRWVHMSSDGLLLWRARLEH